MSPRAPPPANSFSAKKEIRRGKSQKKAKGAAGGARPPFGGQAARLTHWQFCWKWVRAWA